MKGSKLVRLAELEMAKPKTSKLPKQDRIVSANLGPVVKSLREKAQLTQAELAQQAGLAQSNICQFEKGRRQSMSLEVARQLAQAFGLTLPQFRRQIEKARQQNGKKRGEK
jgi:transcriptional regulator with XRE-family HTH domain